MKNREELQALKARAQALGGRLFTLERRIREIEHKPGPPFSKVLVDPEKCVGCGLCQACCPAGAMVLERTARVLADRCIGCGRCIEVCPQGAVSMHVARLNHRKQAGRSL